MKVVMPHAAGVLAPVEPRHTRLLEIDGSEFGRSFDRRPFLVGHHLANHPLFEMTRLIELSQRLPQTHVEYDAGDVPVSLDPTLTPRTGLGVEETIRRIEECRSWMALKFVGQDPAYRQLLDRCLNEVKVFSERIRPGMHQPEAFIFISPAGSITPYHMDAEHTFLLQIRGDKIVSVLDGRDRFVLSEVELEHFYSGTPRNLHFRDEYQFKAQQFRLTPEVGLHVPVTYPHHVKVGPTYSISFSVTFRTQDLRRREMVHRLNGRLRRRGMGPLPFGKSGWRDELKYHGYRLMLGARRLRKAMN